MSAFFARFKGRSCICIVSVHIHKYGQVTLTSVSGDCAWLRIATWLGAWLLRILEYLLTRLQSIQKKKTRKLCIFTSSIKLGQNQFHNTLERVEIGGRVPRLYPTKIVFASNYLGNIRHIQCHTQGLRNVPKRQCQIRVRFESGVKKRFLAALNQLITSFFQCHDLPWSHSFQKRYDMYIVKMNG